MSYLNEFEKWENEMYDKIVLGEKLSTKELSELCYECADENNYGDNRRWSRSVTSIVKLKDKYFSINWEEGLTELQEDGFYEQPVEVKPVEKTITIKEWVKVE